MQLCRGQAMEICTAGQWDIRHHAKNNGLRQWGQGGMRMRLDAGARWELGLNKKTQNIIAVDWRVGIRGLVVSNGDCESMV